MNSIRIGNDFLSYSNYKVKALANHFGGPGSISSAGCSESELSCEIFASVPDIALNGCELCVKPDFNF